MQCVLSSVRQTLEIIPCAVCVVQCETDTGDHSLCSVCCPVCDRHRRSFLVQCVLSSVRQTQEIIPCAVCVVQVRQTQEIIPCAVCVVQCETDTGDHSLCSGCCPV